jgi:NAD(P)-dependent dehydrogenase (short-subunit alcohol dehydrogenase family)
VPPEADPFSLAGRVAVVTGGNQGIGRGIAEALAARGADVVVWGRSAERNEATVRAIVSSGGAAHEAVVDVADETMVDSAMDTVMDRLGRLDVVVACAGVARVAPSTHELSTEQWREVLAVDLDGVLFTFRAALRHLVAQGEGGSMIAIGSRLAANGQPRAPHYSAAKAGLAGLVRAIAREYGGRGIRANLVQPGWIDTPMTAPVLAKPGVAEAQLRRIPMHRWGTPADLAGIATYLASPASSYHTGDVLTVDGGDGLG